MSTSTEREEGFTAFERLSGISVRCLVSGAPYTTYSIGGPLEFLVEVQDVSQAQSAVRAFAELGIHYRVLGFGSNVLIPDEGVPGWTLKLGTGLRTYRSRGRGLFEVGGSMSLMTLSRKLSDLGYAGLEFAGGIPASVGGALFMNAGAHGGEISDIVQVVNVILADGSLARLNPEELNFRYRSSSFPNGCLIVGAELRLQESSRAATAQRRSEYLKARKATQPLTLPSSGSIFKNPSATKTAGELIEAAGLKGERVGGAQVSELHGNWIVNRDRSARADDVKALVGLCQAQVREQFGVDLQRELIFW